MGLDEEELIKELMDKVGMNKNRAKHVMSREPIKNRLDSEGYDSHDQLIEHLEGLDLKEAKIGKGTQDILKKHFKSMEEDAEREADAGEELAETGEKEAKSKKEAGEKSAPEATGKGNGFMNKLAAPGGIVRKGAGKVAGHWRGEGVGSYGFLIFLLPLALWYYDYKTGGNGFDVQQIVSVSFLTEFFTGAVGLLIFLYFFWWLIKRPDKEGKIFGLILIPFAAFLFFQARQSQWVLVHLLTAIIIFTVFLKGFRRDVPITGDHWLFLILLIIDFFGFAAIRLLFLDNPLYLQVSNRLLLPIWYFFLFKFVKPSKMKTFFSIATFLFYLYFLGFGTYVEYNQVIDIQKLGPDARAQLRESAEGVVMRFFNDLQGWITGRIDVATGGYYLGKVEKNKEEPLGVYMTNVRASDPAFFQDERVIIWGTVKARTLDDPVSLNVSCFFEDGDEKIYGEIRPTWLNPDEEEEKGREIFTFEEIDFECRFGKWNFSEGTHEITLATSFNFETESYLKTYYIEQERKRAMTREGIDIFEEFGIRDKKPISVFTNGPIALAIATKTPPAGLDPEEVEGIEVTWVGVGLDHNANWQGSLDDIEELVILVPRGFYLDSELSCNREFKTYGLGECDKSCVDIYSEVENEDFKKEKVELCKENCKFLFGVESGRPEDTFEGYALDVVKIRKEIEERGEDIKENKRFRNFRCGVLVRDPSIILGETPISTKYFRAKARYKYTVVQEKRVRINEVEKKFVFPGGLPTDVVDSSLYSSHNYEGGINWRIDQETGYLESDYLGFFSTVGYLKNKLPFSTCIDNLVEKDYFNDVLQNSKKQEVPAALIMATICTENGQLNEEFKGDDRTSFGLMQIKYTTARDAVGYEGKADGLLDAATNIEYGTKYISHQKPQTLFDPPKVAAAYNHGSITKCCSNLAAEEDDNCENPSKYGNDWCLFSWEGHIDRFLGHWNAAVAKLQEYAETEARLKKYEDSE